MADKIDQLKIGNAAYDIDLPPDAEPLIAALTVSGTTTTGALSAVSVGYAGSYRGTVTFPGTADRAISLPDSDGTLVVAEDGILNIDDGLTAEMRAKVQTNPGTILCLDGFLYRPDTPGPLPTAYTAFVSEEHSYDHLDVDWTNLEYDYWGFDGLALASDVVNKVESITWSNLKTRRDNGTLRPGQKYRITDYAFKTTASYTASADHAFDIIVTALTTKQLSEEAEATQHGATSADYFYGCNMKAWKVWYCIDNDTSRFNWADATNGKGVIYRLIDEHGNDCPYDFKNLLLSRSITSGSATDFTFSCHKSSSDTTVVDASVTRATCHHNVIGERVDAGVRKLPFAIFYTDSYLVSCWNNRIGANAYNIRFKDTTSDDSHGWWNNVVGTQANEMQFGNQSYGNQIGDGCTAIKFGNYAQGNMVGSNCNDVKFGDYAKNNDIGPGCDGVGGEYASIEDNRVGPHCRWVSFASSACQGNDIGPYCANVWMSVLGRYNVIGAGCNVISLKQYCEYNVIGPGCINVTFEQHYTSYNTIDAGVCNVILTSADTSASSSNLLRYAFVRSGNYGSSGSPVTLTVQDRQLDYPTIFQKTGTVTINV